MGVMEVGDLMLKQSRLRCINISAHITKWEHRGSETPPPPSSRQVKTCCPPPPFKGWKLFAPPSLWLKLQAPVLKLHQNCLCPPPFSMAKSPPPPPFFVGVKLHLSPPPPIL